MSDLTIEDKIHEMEKEIALIRLALDMSMISIEKARGLQAAEYERRLEILNGEAARLRQIQIELSAARGLGKRP